MAMHGGISWVRTWSSGAGMGAGVLIDSTTGPAVGEGEAAKMETSAGAGCPSSAGNEHKYWYGE